MTLYKIREIAMILGKDGKPIGKKMVLKSDDQQNEEPRVTVWNIHPECEEAVVGGNISGTMDKKDSGTPIPGRSGNYINRTLLAEGTEVKQTVNGVDLDELKRRVDILWNDSHQSAKVAQKETIDYPKDEYGDEDQPF